MRTTIPWRRARPSSVHSRSKRSVSFEKPVAAGGARFVIARSRACGIRRASHGASCRRVASGSRCWGSGIGRGSSPAEGRTGAAELSSDETAPPRPRDVARGRYRRGRRVALGVGAAATGDLLLRRTCSSRSSISNGFLTQPAAPRRVARSSALACADTTTTGIDARVGSRSCRARNSSPSITGIMRSSRMSEGGGMVCSRSSASLPFAALTTRWPSYSRIGTSASRRSKSSSTTRTVVAPSFISSGMVSHCRPDRFVSQEGTGCQNFEPPAPAGQDAWSPRAWPGACLGDRGMSLLPRGYLDTTVAIESARADGEAIRYRTIGTGFFIGLDYGDRSTSSAESYRLFLVTNRHVLADRGDLLIRVNTREGAALRVRLPLTGGESRGWAVHPDERVDVAVGLINARVLLEAG